MFSGYFVHALELEIKRYFKREFYGWLYGSFKCRKILDDAGTMYMMGPMKGEI